MANKHIGYGHLSSQIVWRFCVFTVVLSGIYGVFSFVLMYNIEDRYIEKGLEQEAVYLTSIYQKTGQWPSPRSAEMSMHFSKATFPTDIRQAAIEDPNEKEFYGQNQAHYHVLTLSGFENTYLVAEVSANLLVRPIREGVIKFLILSGLIVATIACLIAWLIGRKTAKPLRKLADLVDGVAPEQVPETFAHQYPKNEVGILASTLEQSYVRISKAIERERCFTRDVSHELRSPLAVIKNAVEVYKSKQPAESRDDPVINRIGEAAEQMEKTVITLLMLAREEHSTAEKALVPLMPLVEQSVLVHSTLLDGKEVEVIVEDSCRQDILCQEGMLKVLLDNLLSNAFQYTVVGEVTIACEGGTLIVKDTGPGIDPEISKEVTKPAVKSRQSSGFGFGLAIVTRLCEHQGWQLDVTSNNGTEVRVALSD